MNKWDKRFMDMAELVSTWTSCARQGRAIGAIIVKDKRILTTGYNGAPPASSLAATKAIACATNSA